MPLASVEVASPFVVRVPSGPLAAFVNVLWHFDASNGAGGRERLLPTGTTEFVVDLQSGRAEDAVVCGAHSRPFEIERRSYEQLVGVNFKPGGAFPFLGMPACEMRNETASADVLWRGAGRELLDRLLHAPTPAGKLDVMETWLHTIASRPLKRHVAVEFALAALGGGEGDVSIAALADTAGYSQRRFIEVFQDEVGLTPKVYARVQRFQRTLRLLQPMTHVDWADVAAAAGYFDQSHLSHEFRAMCGLSPGAYIARRGEHLNHLPLVD